MSVHCQRLALLNQRSDGEYFAELNVTRDEFPVKRESGQRTDGCCLPIPSASS
jgi:hypothetical protein